MGVCLTCVCVCMYVYTVCVPCPQRPKSIRCSETRVTNEAKDAVNPTQVFIAYFFTTNFHLFVTDLSFFYLPSSTLLSFCLRFGTAFPTSNNHICHPSMLLDLTVKQNRRGKPVRKVLIIQS